MISWQYRLGWLERGQLSRLWCHALAHPIIARRQSAALDSLCDPRVRIVSLERLNLTDGSMGHIGWLGVVVRTQTGGRAPMVFSISFQGRLLAGVAVGILAVNPG